MNYRTSDYQELEQAVLNASLAVDLAEATSDASPADYSLRINVTVARAAYRQAARELDRHCLLYAYAGYAPEHSEGNVAFSAMTRRRL